MRSTKPKSEETQASNLSSQTSTPKPVQVRQRFDQSEEGQNSHYHALDDPISSAIRISSSRSAASSQAESDDWTSTQLSQTHRIFPNKKRTIRRVAVRKHVQCYRLVKMGDGSTVDWRIPLRILLESTPVSSCEDGEANKFRLITSTEEDVRVYPQMRADMIPRPEIWTRTNFAAYVHELCNSPAPRIVRRDLYQSDDQEHRPLVTRMIVELFSDPDARSGFSTAAFNIALEWLEIHSRVDAIRAVFMELERLGHQMNVDTFNIMLRGIGKSQDFSNFTFTLRLMLNRGLTPTGETWVALLMLPDSTRIKMQILECMDKKGLLQNLSILKDALGQVMDGALDGYLNRGWRPEMFMRYADRVWGPVWLSASVANRILNELGRRGLIHELLTVWEILPQRDVLADTVSANTILQHLARLRKPHEVVHLIWQAEERLIRFDEATYEILWRLARRCQLYNVARVVWRYACTEARLSHRMEYQVCKSLLRDSFRSLTTPLERWNATAGKVAVGTRSAKEETPSVLKICQWIDEAKARDGETISLAKDLLRQDLASYQFVRYPESLGRMLQLALELDEAWERAGEETRPVAWKVLNALPMPFFSKQDEPSSSDTGGFVIRKIRT